MSRYRTDEEEKKGKTKNNREEWRESGARTCESNTLGFVSFEKESAPRQVGPT